MTLSSTTVKTSYAGDGTVKAFATGFAFWNSSELEVILVSSSGNETTWTLDTEYSVTGGGGATGTVTASTNPTDFIPDTGETLVIKSNVLDIQGTALPAGGPFPSTSVEQELDRIVRRIQQKAEELDRSLTLSEASTFADLVLPDPEASKVLRWNAAATELENADVAGSSAVTLPLVIAEGGTGATTAAAARAAIFDPLFDAKGDIAAASAADTAVRLAVGAAGTGLRPATGATMGLAWLADGFAVGVVNGSLAWSVAANALTVALKTAAGSDPSTSDPVWVAFRNATAATGTYTWIAVTAALSVVVSNGSNLGVTVNATPFKAWAAAINNAGTVELAVFQSVGGTAPALSINDLADDQIISTTAEGGAGGADTAGVLYSTAARTNVAMRVLGYAEWDTGLATAGAWAAGPTKAQLYHPGVPLPGDVVQEAYSQDSAVATGTTNLPVDDTIPQNTEGDQYMAQAITPRSTAHLLDLMCIAQWANGTGDYLTLALFQDTTAGALAALLDHNDAASVSVVPSLRHRMRSGTVSSTTFKIRAGRNTAGTVTFNGLSGVRNYGGVSASSLKITEVAT